MEAPDFALPPGTLLLSLIHLYDNHGNLGVARRKSVKSFIGRIVNEDFDTLVFHKLEKVDYGIFSHVPHVA